MEPVRFTDCPLERRDWLEEVHTLMSNTNVEQSVVSILVNIGHRSHVMRTDVEDNKLNNGEKVAYKRNWFLTLHNKNNTGKIPEMVHGRHLFVHGIGFIHKPPSRPDH